MGGIFLKLFSKIKTLMLSFYHMKSIKKVLKAKSEYTFEKKDRVGAMNVNHMPRPDFLPRRRKKSRNGYGSI